MKEIIILDALILSDIQITIKGKAIPLQALTGP
jgi:hypothetical protein